MQRKNQTKMCHHRMLVGLTRHRVPVCVSANDDMTQPAITAPRWRKEKREKKKDFKNRGIIWPDLWCELLLISLKECTQTQCADGKTNMLPWNGSQNMAKKKEEKTAGQWISDHSFAALFINSWWWSLLILGLTHANEVAAPDISLWEISSTSQWELWNSTRQQKR